MSRRLIFFQLLKEQASTTLKGIEALEIWLSAGASERCQVVRDLEHQADEQKLILQKRLVESFVTPVDREDLYDLSVRLDEVINAAKNAAREVEALNFCPRDDYLAEMSRTLKEGTLVHSDQEVFWRKDGTALPVEYHTAPVVKAGERIVVGTQDGKYVSRAD